MRSWASLSLLDRCSGIRLLWSRAWVAVPEGMMPYMLCATFLFANEFFV